MDESHVFLAFTREDAFGASQHHRNSTDGNTFSTDLANPTPIGDVDKNRCRVSGVSKTTFVRGDGGFKMRVFGELFVQPSWLAHIDVGVMKIKSRLDIAQNRSVGLDDFSKLDFNKVIE